MTCRTQCSSNFEKENLVTTGNIRDKRIYDIHVSKIFHSHSVVAFLREQPSCTMKLDQPIHSKILNYRETVSWLYIAVDSVPTFIDSLRKWDCSNSQYCDLHHKHVVTGDLRIIAKNNHLQ